MVAYPHTLLSVAKPPKAGPLLGELAVLSKQLSGPLWPHYFLDPATEVVLMVVAKLESEVFGFPEELTVESPNASLKSP